MKILPVLGYKNQTNQNFKGQIKYLNSSIYSEFLSDYPSNSNINWDCSDKIKQYVPTNATIQRTVEDYHSEATNKVYIADPMEKITDAIRKEVDYVVYDNEPEYPDVNKEVSRGYFGNDETNYTKKFNDIREYYYRLEMADTKAAEENRRKILAGVDVDKSKEKMDYYNDRIGQSKYQQWQAAECANLYNKGHDLRIEKGINERQAEELKRTLDYYNGQIDSNLSAIKNYEEHIAENNDAIKIFQKRSALYEQLSKMPKEIYNKYHLDIGTIKSPVYLNLEMVYDEKISAENENTRMKSYIKTYEDHIDLYKEKIKICKANLESLPILIQETKNKITQKENLIKEIKGKLMPLFDELKHFYAKQRIKG